MKVCLLNDSFPPVIDGVVNVVMNYADHLPADHGAEVMVGTPRYPEMDYSQYAYPVVPYPSLDTASLSGGYRAGIPFAERSVSQMSQFGPDIIHAHSPASALIVARLLREQTNAPLVYTYHTKYDIDIARLVKVKAIAQESIRALVNNVEACDEVWTVSRGAGENLRSLGFQGDYRVMDNGVDFAKGRVDAEAVQQVTADYDLPEGVPVYLFVGRIITYKGLPLILDALKRLDEQGQDFRMVFVGKGPDRELMEKKAEELGIAKKVIFVGPIYDRDRLRAWNTRADLFLFPSTFDTNGLVVREAAACGLASVLIRNSCASEGVTDGRNGYLVDETAESMAELLMAVSGDLAHLHDVGQHAMDELYLSWADAVSAAHERYQIILDRKASGQLQGRRTAPTDVMLSGVARIMEEQAKLRRIRHEIRADVKDSAAGMMENCREFGENVREDAHQVLHQTRDSLAEMKGEWKKAAEETDRFYEILRKGNSLK